MNFSRLIIARLASSRTHAERSARARCVFYIPLTFAPDTQLVPVSECRQKVWRFRGERQRIRGLRVGSRVLYLLFLFFFFFFFTHYGRGCGVARFVRYAGRAGHLLTREYERPVPFLRDSTPPPRLFSRFLPPGSTDACIACDIVLLEKKKKRRKGKIRP